MGTTYYDQGWVQGFQDAKNGRPRDPRQHSSLWAAAGGWHNHLTEYLDGYREGYRMGMRER